MNEKDLITEKLGFKFSPHICTVLKENRRSYFRYDENKLTEDEKRIYHLIDLSFSRILICNQAVTQILKGYLIQEYGHNSPYVRNVFPKWLDDFGNELAKKYGDRAIEKRNNLTTVNIEKDITEEVFFERFFEKYDPLDISIPYGDIILLQEEIDKEIVSYMQLEYGYFLGSLLKYRLDDYKKKGLNQFL